MKKEDKELLLKDLCARLQCGVKVYNTTFKEPTIMTLYGKASSDVFLMEETYTSVGVDGDDFGFFNKRHYTGCVDFIKPFLRPMSSMTEEEAKEIAILHDIKDILSIKITDEYIEVVVDDGFCSTEIRMIWYDEIISSIKIFDWLNKHHFDYRGLIEKGLALEAPEGMYNV